MWHRVHGYLCRGAVTWSRRSHQFSIRWSLLWTSSTTSSYFTLSCNCTFILHQQERNNIRLVRGPIQFYKWMWVTLSLIISITSKKNVKILFQFPAEFEVGAPVIGSACSYVVNFAQKRSGFLVSPTYPGAYPKDMSCTYQFIGKPGQRVRIEFRDFDLFYGGPQ